MGPFDREASPREALHGPVSHFLCNASDMQLAMGATSIILVHYGSFHPIKPTPHRIAACARIFIVSRMLETVLACGCGTVLGWHLWMG
jgi:hypothetical protein